MQFDRQGQPNVSGLNKLFNRELIHRIDLIDKLLAACDSNTDCYCDVFGRCKRILDTAELLGLHTLTDFMQAYRAAEYACKKTQDVSPLKLLLYELRQVKAGSEDKVCRQWDLENTGGHIPTAKPNVLHLAIPQQRAAYLYKYFRDVVSSVKQHSCVDDIYGSLQAGNHNVIVFDEQWVHESALNVFEIADAINNQIDLRIIYQGAYFDFDERLQAVRKNISLVCSPEFDEKLIIRAVEKDLVEHEKCSNKLLLVCSDSILSGLMEGLLTYAGFAVDLIASPSKVNLINLHKNKYDLIVVDHYLDDLYGHEFVKILKQDHVFCFVPVLYMCSKTDIGCEIHADMRSIESDIIDDYRPNKIVDKVLNIIRHSSVAGRLGKYMADVQEDNENRRRVLDAHNIVSVTDLSGRIIDVNAKFCEISGYERDELIGKNHRVINSGVHTKNFFVDMWKTIAAGRIWHGEICNRRKNGDYYWVESTIVPLLDDKGRPYQYASARTDITHIKKIENDLRISEERLKRSQSFANIGTWDWNIQDQSLYWSPKIAPLFGYEEGELDTTYENFIECVHPDDRESVIKAVNKCLNGEKEYEIEHRCVWSDGTVKWMLERGDVVRDVDGKPLHMLGVVMDITDRKEAEIARKKQQRLLDLLRNVLSKYIQENDIKRATDYILEGLLALTESQYGMIGEVKYDPLGCPYVKTHAISDLPWGVADAPVNLVERYKEGVEFRNPANLIGYALRTGKPLISNDPAHDPRRGGLPEGHPRIDSFLAVPVRHGDRLVAMYCLANKVSGYDESIIDFLKPFNVTYSSIVNADRMARLQEQTLNELKESRQEAIDANQAKTHFLSNMSHELRTPLNAILGFGQLLEMNLEQNLSTQQIDNVVEIIKAGEHLLSLINEILDLSKIESGKIDMQIEPVSVKEVVVDCVNIINPLAENKKVMVQFDLAEEYAGVAADEWAVMADNLRLKQVLLNLLSNAIKYNHAGGNVRIAVEGDRQGKVRINVRDTGCGIRPDKQHKVFESFNRLGAEKRNIEGTGIGLVICKKIVELMHGRIGFDSVPEQGSCFWVELNATRQSATGPGAGRGIKYPSAIAAGTRGVAKKIIYIEDNLANIRLMSSLFDDIETIELISVQEARLGLDMIHAQKPDMVLLDINMPDMNGYELLSEIKRHIELRHIPVIAVSANAMSPEIKKGLCQGFDDYITKPIVIPAFMEMMNQYLYGIRE